MLGKHCFPKNGFDFLSLLFIPCSPSNWNASRKAVKASCFFERNFGNLDLDATWVLEYSIWSSLNNWWVHIQPTPSWKLTWRKIQNMKSWATTKSAAGELILHSHGESRGSCRGGWEDEVLWENNWQRKLEIKPDTRCVHRKLTWFWDFSDQLAKSNERRMKILVFVILSPHYWLIFFFIDFFFILFYLNSYLLSSIHIYFCALISIWICIPCTITDMLCLLWMM